MRLEGALQYTATRATPESFENFRQHIDPLWIEEALCATGTATLRKRRLPAVQVLWIVLGMALFRNRAIERVVASLDLALPGPRRDLVAKSAIAKARQRLTEAPVEYLFTTTAAEWAACSAEKDRWRNLSLYAYDGTTLRVPDTRENRATFGGQSAGGKKGESGYPMVRAVGLIAVRSHLLSAFRFGDYHTGEVTLARELWREVPEQSLTLVDRGFPMGELALLHQSGKDKHFITRVRKQMTLRTIEKLGRKDHLVELTISPAARKENLALPETVRLRVIQYQRKGFRASSVITSLLDSDRYPAQEIVALYHERWEIEMVYDEAKTHLLAREECIRSKTPAGVSQELWGIALAYNLVRLEIARIADELGVSPTRISFVTALDLIRDEWIWCSNSTPGAIPKQLADLSRMLKLLILPQRRAERSNPRVVKIKMSNYNRKRPSPTRKRAK
jgi:Insertion element 4 transposase N-terminal/Transposase DDE domain